MNDYAGESNSGQPEAHKNDQYRKDLAAIITDPVGLATKLREVKALLDAAEAEAKTHRGLKDFIEKIALVEAMENQNLSNFKVPGVGRVNLRGDLYVSVKAGQKEGAYSWLEDNGRGDLIQPTVNASTLKASVKAAMERGEEFPAELFNITPYTAAVLTRA